MKCVTMSCVGLFLLLVVFPVSQTSTLDCSDQQSTGSASGMADHQQVTTLQYCLIDNCTIMRVDNGEILDIIFTTDSLLITTSRGNQTSLVIAKDEAELWCANAEDRVFLVVLVVLSSVIVFASGYILTIHLIFPELRNTIGKILIISSSAMILLQVSNVAITLMNTEIALDSLFICRIVVQASIQAYMVREACSTCILAYVVHMMNRSDNLKQGMPKHLFRFYMAYLIGSLVIFNISAILYDAATGDADQLLLPSGHCEIGHVGQYDVMYIMVAYGTLNKAVQVGLFVVYLFYFYKFSTEGHVGHKQTHRRLSKIAVNIGATVGIAKVAWFILALTGQAELGVIIGIFILTIQEFVIMAIFMCNKKVAGLCKQKLGKE